MSKLTGKTRYRSSFRGKLILQVETSEEVIVNDGPRTRTFTSWRDARIEDLQYNLKETP